MNQLIMMLFCNEIEDFNDDGFEGSVGERQIFTEVFFGNDFGHTSKRCVVTGVINFESEIRTHSDASHYWKSENSALSSQSSSKYNHVKDSNNLNQSSRTLVENRDDVNVKRMRMSFDESNAEKRDGFGLTSLPSHSVSRTVTYHLVESCSEGVTTRSYLLKRLVKVDRDDTGDNGVSKSRFPSLGGNSGKEIVISRSVASPVSQESIANKLLVAGPSVAIAVESGSPVCAVEETKESSFQELHRKKNSVIDPRPLLQYHTNRLLREAGWTIKQHIRRRKSNYLASIYMSPEGRQLREFSKAWNVCGENLFKTKYVLVQENDGMQWNGIHQFWCDLSNLLIDIEKEVIQSDTNTPLAYQWSRLNPFVEVVFLDRKIGALRKGNVVKVSRSFVIDKSDKDGATLPLKFADGLSNKVAWENGSTHSCDSSLAAECALTVSKRKYHFGGENSGETNLLKLGVQTQKSRYSINEARKRSYGPSGNILRYSDLNTLPAYELDSIQFYGCLHDVPVSVGHINMVPGDSKTTSPNEDSCTGSPIYDRQCSERIPEMHVDVDDAILINCRAKTDQWKSVNELAHHQNDSPILSHDTNQTYTGLGSPVNSFSQLCSPSAIKYNNLDFHDDGLKGNLHVVQEQSGPFSPEILPSEAVHQLRHIEEEEGEGRHYSTSKLTMSDTLSAVDVISNNNRYEKPEWLSDVKVVASYANDYLGNGTLESQSSSKVIKLRKADIRAENVLKGSSRCQIKDDDLLISVVIKNKDFSPPTKCNSVKAKTSKSKARRKLKNPKGSYKLLPRSLGKGGMHFVNGKWLTWGLRTVLSWLIDSGVVSLNDVIEYRNPKDNGVVKGGLITKNGILCKCCSAVLSLSEFKRHAGHVLDRPCLNLFMGSGQPLILCQLQAWSAEYKTRKGGTKVLQVDEPDQNDDACGLCGDGGELICCDGCPSTFHQTCLCVKELPEGSWYCPNCTCQICGDVVNDKETSSSFGGVKCSQCQHKYHKACLRIKDKNEGVAFDSWFCGTRCHELYSRLDSCIGVMNHIPNGFVWTLLKCIRDDQKVHSAQRFALKAECNSKLAVALTIMEECFLSMIDRKTGIDILPQMLYNWESRFLRLNFHGFYTIVLEKDDVLMTVASIRLHGARVAEMPLVATCSRYRRQGMCRRLMNAIEEMLKSWKVEMLVIAAIPELLETWSAFGFEALEDHEKANLKNINLMVFAGSILLKKRMYANPEVNKLPDDEDPNCASFTDTVLGESTVTGSFSEGCHVIASGPNLMVTPVT